MKPIQCVPKGEAGRNTYVIQHVTEVFNNATGGIWMSQFDQITSTANTEWALFLLADENDDVDANTDFVVVFHTLMPELLQIAQEGVFAQNSIRVMSSYIDDFEAEIQKLADHFFTVDEQNILIEEGGFYELTSACIEKALASLWCKSVLCGIDVVCENKHLPHRIESNATR